MHNIGRIAICITFYYRKSRLDYLIQTCSEFSHFATSVCVIIITNSEDENQLKDLANSVMGKGFEYKIRVARDLGHPYLLTWIHLDVFRELFRDERFTHFLYVEDDIYLTKKNIEYWLSARELLKPFGLLPSFLRYELRGDERQLYATDATSTVFVNLSSRLIFSPEQAFLNLPNPYQGLYLLDRELMSEHLNGSSSNPDFGEWGIREKAAQGLTFVNIPAGCTARNMVPYNPSTLQIDRECLVHHLPNNYSTDPTSMYGKIAVSVLLKSSWFFGGEAKNGIPRIKSGIRDWIPPVFFNIGCLLPPIFLRGLKRVGRGVRGKS